MREIPPIRAVMTPFPYSVQASDLLGRAREMMAEHDIRHLPVMDGPRLVSVVSERDLRRKGDRIQDVCSDEAYIVECSELLDVVLMQMAERHIGSVLVVKEGRLAGIFTVTDACRHYGQFLRTLFPRTDGEDAA